jgi:NTE family protein
VTSGTRPGLISDEGFLGGVPIFACLRPEMLAKVAEQAEPVALAAGAWLFHRGDPGDALYVIKSGRLEVLIEESGSEVARHLSRGAVVGELALVADTPRSASVRARRDSVLLKVRREEFEELMIEPAFAVALNAAVAAQLRESRGLVLPEPAATVVAILPLEPGLPAEELADRLVQDLRPSLDVACLKPEDAEGDRSGYGPVLDAAERENDRVLLLAGPLDEGDPWSEFCLRQADLVVALAGRGLPAKAHREPGLRGCELVYCRDDLDPGAAARLGEVLEPARSWSATTAGGWTLVDALARRLTGRSVGIVFSGGGARAFAHIGVLDELLRSNVKIDRVGGCSMGAYVGAMFAMGASPTTIRDRCREEFVQRNPLSDYTLPSVSLVRGQRAWAMIRRTFGRRMIHELPREFFSVSCDLLRGELVVDRRGLLADAVGASMCLPGILPPVQREDRLLVDGGVLDNLPVAAMASNEGPVIAVDVTARFVGNGLEPDAGARAGWAFRGRRRTGPGRPLPGLKETLIRSIGIGSGEAIAAARKQADLLIAPDTGVVGMLDFAQLDRMVEAGREAAAAALAEAPELSSLPN